MKKLHFLKIEPNYSLENPVVHNHVTLDSPALSIVTDFQHVKPLVIDSDCSVLEAEYLMRKAHSKSKIVVGQNDEFLGLVTLPQLNHQEVVKKVAEGYERFEIKVNDLMTKRLDLEALDYDELKKANIQDVLFQLRDLAQQHCIVVDQEDGKIRGIISASDVSRKLLIPMKLERGVTFANLYHAVNTLCHKEVG